jgi:CheY-like chemotaxis protein
MRARRESPNILVAEDDDNQVVLLRRAFEKVECGEPLRVFSDGEQVISFLEQKTDRQKNECAALLLLDLKMPRKNGFDVLQWKRENAHLRRLLVIVMSNSNQREDVNRAYDLGVNSYLVKPNSFDDLVGLVKMIYGYWMLKNETPDWG